MSKLNSHFKAGVMAISVVAIVLFSNIPSTASAAVTVSIKANNVNPLTLAASTTPFDLTWDSPTATACQLTDPTGTTTGVATSTTGAPSITINPGHPWYPAVGGSSLFTINCDDGAGSTATDNVTVSLPAPAVPTVDVKANASDGPIALNPGGTFIYTWVSANSTSCQQTTPTATGIGLTGTSTAIATGDPLYPSTTTPTIITVSCTNGTQTATDSVTISLNSVVVPAPTIDVKVNGSDGPVALNPGDTFVYTWVSANSTACQQTTPITQGSTLAGTSTPIASGDPLYPTTASSTTITFTCTNGSQSASDFVVISLNSVSVPVVPPTSGGGGGGGGTSGGSRHTGYIPPTGSFSSCPLVHTYMGENTTNNPVDVMALQTFLKAYMGYSYVSVTGVYDHATFLGVAAFQVQYKDRILTPWGRTEPTGYVYILTLNTINSVYCGTEQALTPSEQAELASYRATIESARAQGTLHETATSTTVEIPGTNGTTTIELPVVGQVTPKGQNLLGFASTFLALPNNIKDIIPFLLRCILLLGGLYFYGTVLLDVLEKSAIFKKFSSTNSTDGSKQS